MNPQVTVGYLGWSNQRLGLEFYVGGEGNARWEQRRRPRRATRKRRRQARRANR